MALEVGDHVGCAKEKKNVNQSYSKEEEIVLMCLEGPTRAPLVSLDDNLVSYVGLTTLNIALLGGNPFHLSYSFQTCRIYISYFNFNLHSFGVNIFTWSFCEIICT